MKTCTDCKQLLPFTNFYKHPYNKDGLDVYCKQCHARRSRVSFARHQEKSIAQVASGEVTTKKCPSCKKVLPLSDYNKSKNNSYGVQSKCRVCSKVYAKELYQKGVVPARKSERRDEIRLEVFTYYSKGTPHCACCKTTYLNHLAIDHIDGYAMAFKRGIGVRGGLNLWHYLRNNNYPEGFQVLCHNCNMIKYQLGACGCQTSK